MRVKCANCKTIYNISPVQKCCTSCKSNAYDPVKVETKPARQDEHAVPSGPRLLLDDAPAPSNLLNG